MLFEDEEECYRHLSSISKKTYTGNRGFNIHITVIRLVKILSAFIFHLKLGSGVGCNGTFDGFLCWEALSANTTITIKCPEFKGVFDPSSSL